MQRALEEEIQQLKKLKELRELEEEKALEEARLQQHQLENEARLAEIRARQEARVKAQQEIAYQRELLSQRQRLAVQNLFKGKTHDGQELKKKPQPVRSPQWRSANAEMPKQLGRGLKMKSPGADVKEQETNDSRAQVSSPYKSALTCELIQPIEVPQVVQVVV